MKDSSGNDVYMSKAQITSVNRLIVNYRAGNYFFTAMEDGGISVILGTELGRKYFMVGPRGAIKEIRR